jgi:hypothetical protein
MLDPENITALIRYSGPFSVEGLLYYGDIIYLNREDISSIKYSLSYLPVLPPPQHSFSLTMSRTPARHGADQRRAGEDDGKLHLPIAPFPTQIQAPKSHLSNPS